MKKRTKVFNFRTSEDKLLNFRKRTKEAKANNTTPEEIYENGLLIEEAKDEERTVLNRKLLAVANRNEAIYILNDYNSKIRAFNLRLKAIKSDKYKDLDPEKDVIKLFDEKGNRII